MSNLTARNQLSSYLATSPVAYRYADDVDQDVAFGATIAVAFAGSFGEAEGDIAVSGDGKTFTALRRGVFSIETSILITRQENVDFSIMSWIQFVGLTERHGQTAMRLIDSGVGTPDTAVKGFSTQSIIPMEPGEQFQVYVYNGDNPTFALTSWLTDSTNFTKIYVKRIV